MYNIEGHGVDNARVEFNPYNYTKDIYGKTYTTTTPVGDSMVGSGDAGRLYSVHDLKHELNDCKPEKAIVTLDCCRTERRTSNHIVTLR